MNIEKTISEHAVSDILTPMLESQDRIVTEDVAPLFDQATGLDTPPASGTVTTTIEESRSVISAIIRKAWTATLTMLGGASVISYIAAAYTYLRTRLQGNETYGIPDRRSEISASSPLAANLALLNDRKIGGADVPDGISLARLISDATAANAVTTLTDDNTGWTLNSSKLKALLGLLPKVETVTANGIGQLAQQTIQGNAELKTLNLTGVTSAYSQYSDGDSDAMRSCIMQNPKLEEVYAPSLTDYTCGGNGNQYNALISGCHALKKVTLGKVANNNYPGWGGTKWVIQYCEALEELHVAGVVETNCLVRSGQNANLILLKFTAEQANSANLAWWNPTNVLADQDKLATFLTNFKNHIANRLTDNGSGKTLTLSQAVFSEIWDSQGQPQVKGDGLDELRADIHRIVRTRKQWAVNKA